MFTSQEKVKIQWSPNFAYAIGLIVSDGWLSTDQRHIGFKSRERELVLKFRKALRIRNKIGCGVRGSEKIKKYSYVFCGDVVFYKFLNQIGIHHCKSRTIQRVVIPKEFFADFLRGLFDGDGTFYTFWDTRWPSSFGYQIAFPSASLDFIIWLKNKLSVFYGVKGFIRRGDGVFNLRYVKGDTRKLFTTMYIPKPNLFLIRKYKKIKSALDMDIKRQYILPGMPR